MLQRRLCDASFQHHLIIFFLAVSVTISSSSSSSSSPQVIMNLAIKLVLALCLACQSSVARAVENSNTAFVDQLEAVALRGSQGTKDPHTSSSSDTTCLQPAGGCRKAFQGHVWNKNGGECGQCYCHWNDNVRGPDAYECRQPPEDSEEELLL